MQSMCSSSSFPALLFSSLLFPSLLFPSLSFPSLLLISQDGAFELNLTCSFRTNLPARLACLLEPFGVSHNALEEISPISPFTFPPPLLRLFFANLALQREKMCWSLDVDLLDCLPLLLPNTWGQQKVSEVNSGRGVGLTQTTFSLCCRCC